MASHAPYSVTGPGGRLEGSAYAKLSTCESCGSQTPTVYIRRVRLLWQPDVVHSSRMGRSGPPPPGPANTGRDSRGAVLSA